MNTNKYKFGEATEREIIAHIYARYREECAQVKANLKVEYDRCMKIVDERMDELPYE